MSRFLVVVAAVTVTGGCGSRSAECEVDACDPIVVDACISSVEACERVGGPLRKECVDAILVSVSTCEDGIDDDDDNGTADDDFDTGPGAGDDYFEPVSASFIVELAYDRSHELSEFVLEGQEYQPGFYVRFLDAFGTSCVLGYSIDVDAFNAYLDSSSDSDSSATNDYEEWLGNQALVAGVVIESGLYTPAITPGCRFDPAEWGDDPHDAFLFNSWEVGWVDDVSADILAEVDDLGGFEEIFGAGFDEDNALGGLIRLPANYFGQGSQRQFSVVGFMAKVNASMEVQSSGGDLVYIDATDAVGVSGPNSGLVRLFPLVGVSFN